MSKYEIVVGIETHVQLATKSKLFCACNNDSREVEPNTHVCPVCLGFPGALPFLNEEAVKLALRAGVALHAYENVRQFHTKFDRKNYFYPDSPMNYQITQYDEPIIGKGQVEFPVDGVIKRVGITRAHLEADAGKLVHPAGVDYSLVDLNRAGTPLLEIVSEPDMRSAAEAKAYAQELYHLMRYAGVSDADLYHGNMRFDVNVSLRPVDSKEFGTRTESKNLNSFRAVAGVVEYEAKRQAELLERGERVVQETRGWDDAKQCTFSQRSKEEAHDYRYFPEPDLPPLVITEKMLAEARAAVPEMMPAKIRTYLAEHQLAGHVLDTLLENIEFSERIVEVVKTRPQAVRMVANWLTGEVQAALTAEVAGKVPTAAQLLTLAEMVDKAEISATAAKKIIGIMTAVGGDPRKIAEAENLLQVSDAGALEKIVDEVIAANPQPVADFRAGQAKALGFLVGQVMKASHGQANPPMVNAILKKKLGG